MKKLASILALIVFSLSGCEGPAGPQGPQGVQGTYIVGQTIESTVNFTKTKNFETYIDFNKPLYDSDVVLVYVLRGTDSQNNPIWRQLPQSVILPQGTFNYNFDFTKYNLRLFLESALDLSTIDTVWTLDQTFRIVVVPADFAKKMAKASYEQVTTALKLQEEDFKTVTP